MHATLTTLFARKELVLIAGPCVVEGEEFVVRHAERVKALCERLSVPVIFKASFDKANRTSVNGYRGPGMAAGLVALAKVKAATGLPVLTDVHSIEQCAPTAEVADVLQIPAFLCRQTDLIAEAAKTGKPLNIKKGQFLAPEDMRFAIDKAREVGGTHQMVTERGASFGYRDLVVDMRALITLGTLGVPVVFDATHSVQKPGSAGGSTGGDRLLAGPLARGAVAVGVDAVFAEVHEDPEHAKSDGPNSLTFELLERLLVQCKEIHASRRRFPEDPR
ncbi:MAG: 3-deoxy-8-phosphooctulonate synthase [Deltaproteobacteria bacterium]|nr:3-deoxy-8-phosphooctulonate synthase [Deltaproteobacteria bacterium]